MDIAEAFASIVVADGRARDVEKLNAEAFLECFREKYNLANAELDLAKRAFSAKNEDAISELLEIFETLPTADQLELLRALWTVAICDGELHPAEEQLIYRFINAANRSSIKALKDKAAEAG